MNGETELNQLFERYPALEACRQEIAAAYDLLRGCFAAGGRLLVCGNGGSAADSLHIVGELMKGFALPRKLSADWEEQFKQVCPEMAPYLMENLQGALPAISLVGETAMSTAYANDQAPDLSFAQQVLGQGKAGDVLLCISTSGNSTNVLYAAAVARAMELRVIGLAGQGGGRLKGLSDVCICAPSRITYQIQEYHLPIYHALCLALEREFFGEA